jgi:hypothetical protein
VKTYTFYSDSHKHILHDYYLKTFPFEDDLELVVRKIPQDCPSASFMHQGWMSAMRKKMEYVMDSILETKGKDEFFIHSDCDIIFFDKIKDNMIEEIGDNDIACIDDVQMLCAGFFIARPTDKIVKLFDSVLKNMDHFSQSGSGDQIAMNYYINDMGIKAKPLGRRYHNIFHSIEKEWTPGVAWNFDVPDDIVMHHSNFTRGIETKVALMDIMVKKGESTKTTVGA